MNTLPTLEQIRIMNTRPTPETDKFFATFADGEYAPSHAEYYARLQDLERERDEARAEMIRWMSIAEGRGRTDDDDTGKAMAKLIRQRDEARGQRDRLADALEQLMAYQPRSTVITTNERHVWSNAKDALQSLNQPEP